MQKSLNVEYTILQALLIYNKKKCRWPWTSSSHMQTKMFCNNHSKSIADLLYQSVPFGHKESPLHLLPVCAFWFELERTLSYFGKLQSIQFDPEQWVVHNNDIIDNNLTAFSSYNAHIFLSTTQYYLSAHHYVKVCLNEQNSSVEPMM